MVVILKGMEMKTSFFQKIKFAQQKKTIVICPNFEKINSKWVQIFKKIDK
jgi:hypothetical protein